jgi:hypothetical protein
MPHELSHAGLVARAALVALLALWTLGFLRHGLDARYLMDSFLHMIHLPFHEAGHVLLMPFGRFLSVLGGSAFQVTIPLLCGTAFLLKNRDPFAASVTLWWAGQSLTDLAPYIADARALRLPLLGGATGAEVEGHDWEYLLGALDLLSLTQRSAGCPSPWAPGDARRARLGRLRALAGPPRVIRAD